MERWFQTCRRLTASLVHGVRWREACSQKDPWDHYEDRWDHTVRRFQAQFGPLAKLLLWLGFVTTTVSGTFTPEGGHHKEMAFEYRFKPLSVLWFRTTGRLARDWPRPHPPATPPAHRLLAFGMTFFSPRTYKEELLPTVSDMRHEYLAALRDGAA